MYNLFTDCNCPVIFSASMISSNAQEQLLRKVMKLVILSLEGPVSLFVSKKTGSSLMRI